MKRDYSIDIVRGIAVVLMIASHVTWFFATDNIPFWHTIRQFGDAICFITFMFTFGVAQYFSLFSKENSKELYSKSIRRVLILIGAYYLVAFVSLLPFVKSSTLNIEVIIKTLLLVYVPGFTEYLIPFVLYSIIFIILKKTGIADKIFKNKKYILYLLTVGFLCYGVGYILYELLGGVEMNIYLKSYISLFAGHIDVYLRYPVLQYAVVPLLGIGIGKVISENTEKRNTDLEFVVLFITLSIMALLIYALSMSGIESWIGTVTRFPPSLIFIIQNLTIVLGIAILVRKSMTLKIWAPLKSYGTYSLAALIGHILILRIFEYFGMPKTDNAWVLLVYFLIALHVLYLYVLPRRLLTTRKNNE